MHGGHCVDEPPLAGVIVPIARSVLVLGWFDQVWRSRSSDLLKPVKLACCRT